MDHLHQRHLCDRVEEVQTNQSLGLFQRRRQFVQRNGRCVGCENGVRFEIGFQRLVQALFGLRILIDGLDHHIGPTHTPAIDVRNQPRQRASDLIRCLQALFEQSLGALQCRFDIFHLPVLQGNFEALHHAPGRDVSTHDAGPDHMHPPRPEVAAFAIGFELFSQAKHPAQIA